jgi:hypothetical protein
VQREWGLKHCLKHVAYRTKKQTSCLDCGHVWAGPQKVKSCICPACGTRLHVEDTLKRKLDQREWMAVLDVNNEFQVVRIFEIFSYHKAGEKARYYVWEVIQQFFNPDLEMQVVGRLCGSMGNGNNFYGDMEIRSTDSYYGNKYDLWPTKIYPKIKCLPEYKRNGYTVAVHGISPYQIFNKIISDNVAETLLKVKQYGLLELRLGNKRHDVKRHWDSVKICIRNKYMITAKDAVTWLDYMDLLEYFRKDRRSPKYVCPTNLKKDHDRLVKKKVAEEKRRTIEKQKQKIESSQKAYIKSKGMFFGLAFTSGRLTVKVLEHVEEFLNEGLSHHHCVFTNAYYKKEDSLIFSAQINGQSVETVEVSLTDFRIVQSRGIRNQATDYNQQIIDLINKNMKAIADRRKAVKKEAA